MIVDSPLHRAVLAEPDNMVVRRVYADFLMESGDPQGEFIAAAIALDEAARGARVVRTEVLREIGNTYIRLVKACWRNFSFGEMAGYERWTWPIWSAWECDNVNASLRKSSPALAHCTPDTGGPIIVFAEGGGVEMSLVFGCGMIKSVRVTAELFMKHAGVMFRTSPITEVRLIHRSTVAGHYFVIGAFEANWINVPDDEILTMDMPYQVPASIFAHLDSDRFVSMGSPSAACNAADTALAEACVNYGRSLVGLDPLPSRWREEHPKVLTAVPEELLR